MVVEGANAGVSSALTAYGGKPLPPADEQRRLRVLLVDCQDLIHWGFKMLLAAEPWVERFVAAHNATHALELARRYHPHVAVIDMQLGGESGADLCEQLRESGDRRLCRCDDGLGRAHEDERLEPSCGQAGDVDAERSRELHGEHGRDRQGKLPDHARRGGRDLHVGRLVRRRLRLPHRQRLCELRRHPRGDRTLLHGGHVRGERATEKKFTLGSGTTAQTCTGTTSASGTASCSIASVAQTPGSVAVAASFAGDSFYLPASASSTVDVVAPTGAGAFVIGDNSAGSPTIGKAVYFWGSEWSNSNSLSGGPAPSAMKGFADTPVSITCGSTWTTHPGDSSSPPASTPAQIAVIVSDKVTRSGSTISGTVAHIVIVQVDAGYGPAPGHVGTGTIVSTIC